MFVPLSIVCRRICFRCACRIRVASPRRRSSGALHPGQADVASQPVRQFIEVVANAMREQSAVDRAGAACGQPPQARGNVRRFGDVEGDIGHGRLHRVARSWKRVVLKLDAWSGCPVVSRAALSMRRHRCAQTPVVVVRERMQGGAAVTGERWPVHQGQRSFRCQRGQGADRRSHARCERRVFEQVLRRYRR